MISNSALAQAQARERERRANPTLHAPAQYLGTDLGAEFALELLQRGEESARRKRLKDLPRAVNVRVECRVGMGRDATDMGQIIGRRSIERPKPPARKPGRTWDLARGGYDRAMR
jgi:hypothetical protein